MAGSPKRGLPPRAFLKSAGPGKTIRVYRDKEDIYLQGSPADAVFYLQRGMVKLSTVFPHRRKKAVVALLRGGDLFGEGCLGREQWRVSTATSIGPCTITRVEKLVFRKKLAQDSAFSAMFMKHLLSQVERFEADLADQLLNFSERRLARILLLHRGFAYGSTRAASKQLLSQTTLAEMVGTTRARISFFMNEFKGKGYLHYNGGLEIDSKRLAAFLAR